MIKIEASGDGYLIRGKEISQFMKDRLAIDAQFGGSVAAAVSAIRVSAVLWSKGFGELEFASFAS